MAKKVKQEDAAAGAPMWMVTYGDMMTLLLTFFVLILSFSSIQEAGFKQAMGSLQGALGILDQHEYLMSLGRIMAPDSTFAYMVNSKRDTLGDITKRLNTIFADENVAIQQDENGVNIVLPAEVLFESGDARVKREAFPLMKKIGAFLHDLKDTAVTVTGHTDERPIKTQEYPTNWHLSTERAISVVGFLHSVAGIDNERMIASGRAEFNPVVVGKTEEAYAQNRRVEIFIAHR